MCQEIIVHAIFLVILFILLGNLFAFSVNACPAGQYQAPGTQYPCRDCPPGRLASPANSWYVEDCPVDPCFSKMFGNGGGWRHACDHTRCYASQRCCPSSPWSTEPDGFCAPEYAFCLWNQTSDACYSISGVELAQQQQRGVWG